MTPRFRTPPVDGGSFDLTYLSLGAGVQSSALLVCSALGLHGVPKADVAIFADTQNEPPHVYEAVARLSQDDTWTLKQLDEDLARCSAAIETIRASRESMRRALGATP